MNVVAMNVLGYENDVGVEIEISLAAKRKYVLHSSSLS